MDEKIKTTELDCNKFPEALAEGMRHGFEIYNVESAKVFLSIEWVPDHNIRCKVLNAIENLWFDGQIDRAKKLFKRYCFRLYDENKLWETVSIWAENEFLIERMPVLKQAISAHIQGMYFLSIPAFCIQIEGYLADFDSSEKRLSQSRIKQIVGDFGVFNIYSKTIEEYMDKILLKGFDRGKALESDLSRNAILHGYDLSYGTKENSLKLIMLINIIQHMSSNYLRNLEGGLS